MFKSRQNTLAIKSSLAASLFQIGERGPKNLNIHRLLLCTLKRHSWNIPDLKLAFFHTGWQATRLEGLIKSFLAETLELRPAFCSRVPPSPPYRGVAVPQKTGKRVNPSPTLTPKFAARSAITEEAWLSWDELKSHCKLVWQHPLNHNSWPFLADSRPLQTRRGNLPAKRHPETHFPEGPPPPDPQSGNGAGETRTPPGSGDTQSAHRETEQTRETRLKSSTLWTKESPKTCPNASQCPASPRQPHANFAPQNSGLRIPM